MKFEAALERWHRRALSQAEAAEILGSEGAVRSTEQLDGGLPGVASGPVGQQQVDGLGGEGRGCEQEPGRSDIAAALPRRRRQSESHSHHQHQQRRYKGNRATEDSGEDGRKDEPDQESSHQESSHQRQAIL